MLAGLGELGPVAGHRRVQVELAALDELVHAGTGQALGAGQHGGQRVHLPRARAFGVSRAGPQVDDQFAVDPGGDRCANFLALQKVLLERLAYAVETRLA